eukprot:810656-Prorocentrum_minimum.AAC.1
MIKGVIIRPPSLYTRAWRGCQRSKAIPSTKFASMIPPGPPLLMQATSISRGHAFPRGGKYAERQQQCLTPRPPSEESDGHHIRTYLPPDPLQTPSRPPPDPLQTLPGLGLAIQVSCPPLDPL